MSVCRWEISRLVALGKPAEKVLLNMPENHAPKDTDAALEQKRAAEAVADDELAPLTVIEDELAPIWVVAEVFTVSGTSGPVTFDGVVCIDKPFELVETFETGSGTVSFAPTSRLSGIVSDTSNSGGCEQSGIGNYVISLNEKGAGTLKWTITMNASCPPYTVTKPFSFELPLPPLPGVPCAE